VYEFFFSVFFLIAPILFLLFEGLKGLQRKWTAEEKERLQPGSVPPGEIKRHRRMVWISLAAAFTLGLSAAGFVTLLVTGIGFM